MKSGFKVPTSDTGSKEELFPLNDVLKLLCKIICNFENEKQASAAIRLLASFLRFQSELVAKGDDDVVDVALKTFDGWKNVPVKLELVGFAMDVAILARNHPKDREATVITQAFSFLTRAASHKEHVVRAHVYEAISKVQDAEWKQVPDSIYPKIEQVIDLCVRESDVRVKAAVAKAIGSLCINETFSQHPRMLPFLVEKLLVTSPKEGKQKATERLWHSWASGNLMDALAKSGKTSVHHLIFPASIISSGFDGGTDYEKEIRIADRSQNLAKAISTLVESLLQSLETCPNLKVRIHSATALRQYFGSSTNSIPKSTNPQSPQDTQTASATDADVSQVPQGHRDRAASVARSGLDQLDSSSADARFEEMSYMKQLRHELPEYGKKAALIERLEIHDGITANDDMADRIPSRKYTWTRIAMGWLTVPRFLIARERRRKELSRLRSGLTVWTSPFTILRYFFLYMAGAIKDGLVALSRQRLVMALLAAIAGSVVYVYTQDGDHVPLLRTAEKEILWYGWWVVLGIASSIGLGTGLHTFVLFLGPHIAHVTMTAYQCGSLNFDDRGPNRYVCPDTKTLRPEPVTVFLIFAKIRLESFFWGLGTSIGELPPYFVARAAAAAGKEDADFNSIERILEKSPEDRTVMEKGQVFIYTIVQKLGFVGIVLCASIPNPLFDLAGIICGHFGVPFMTFWGATFVGKACVKNFIQSFAIIVLFSEEILAVILDQLETLWPWLHSIVKQFLDAQVRQFASKPGSEVPETDDSGFFSPAKLLSTFWNAVLGGMVLYFLLSLIEALALQELKRRHDDEVRLIKAQNAVRAAVAQETNEQVQGSPEKAKNKPKER
ncbi:Vacuolar membrane protease [Phlyctochytrium bullatum]|nr:Vacuolar membrane protease [Phlyctochytrium bullatum]